LTLPHQTTDSSKGTEKTCMTASSPCQAIDIQHPTTLHSSSAMQQVGQSFICIAMPTLLLEGFSHCNICATLPPLLLIVNDVFSELW